MCNDRVPLSCIRFIYVDIRIVTVVVAVAVAVAVAVLLLFNIYTAQTAQNETTVASQVDVHLVKKKRSDAMKKATISITKSFGRYMRVCSGSASFAKVALRSYHAELCLRCRFRVVFNTGASVRNPET